MVVNPDTTHCIVDSREDHHRSLVWVLVSDFFVHIMMSFTEKLLERICIAVNGCTETEIDGKTISFKAPYRRLPILEGIDYSTAVLNAFCFVVQENTSIFAPDLQ